MRRPVDPISSSGYAADGFAAVYDRHRPAPPEVLLDVLSRLAGAERPRVVDLGTGTGLSARAWADRAESVVGVEAQAAMLEHAEGANGAASVRYVLGFADDTGLPDECADVVTCSQSFHWMEPQPVLAEAARILRPGGVFAAYDYDVPPVLFDLETEHAFAAVAAERRRRRAEVGRPAGAEIHRDHPKERHVAEIRASGRFRFARELVLHHEEPTSAKRVVGYAESIGGSALGTDEELGLVALREAAERARPARWLIGYRVRVGIR